LVTAALLDRFASASAGRLSSSSIAQLDALLALALEL
jgi:hypothetical protein